MGFASDELGKHTEAIVAYEKVIAIDPESDLATLADHHISRLKKK